MKFFAVLFAAFFAMSMASPVELELEERDFMNTIIEMIKGFVCGMDSLPFDNPMLQMVFNMVKGFLNCPGGQE